MSTATASTVHQVTADEAAALYADSTSGVSAAKWKFLDAVAAMVDQHPKLNQREVVDMIGDTPAFRALHGDHRDGGPQGAKAKSRLKSIRDELSVVKVWAPAHRVDGVSFEAHKVLNRLGASAGEKILATLVKEAGGPGNVTKAMVVARLKVADPDHTPQANGKKTGAAGNQAVTTTVPATREMTLIEMAFTLGSKLTVGELGKDAELAKAVERIADVYEAFAQRKQAKAAASAPKQQAAPTSAKSAAKRRPVGVKAPVSTPQRPSVKTPSVKTPVS